MAEQTELIYGNPDVKLNNLESRYCEVNIYYDYDTKNKKGKSLIEKIEKISIQESIFTTLPACILKLNDEGDLTHKFQFEIGKNVYITMTPKINQDLLLPKPYIQAEFIIQGITTTLNANGLYNILLYCIYPAEKYLNDICIWPNDVLYATQSSSKTTINLVSTLAGLLFESNIATDTNDSMNWICANMRYIDFIKKIADHSWLSDNDIPLLYTTLDTDENNITKCTLHYDSLEELTNKPLTDKYMEAQRYFLTYKTENKEYYKLYTGLNINNTGYMQNYGAYGIKTYTYNPYSDNNKDFIKNIPNIKTKKLNNLADHLIHKDYQDIKLRLSKSSNKSANQLNTYRYINYNTHFNSTHKYYDFAPLHHHSIKTAFFQNFINITLDAFTQQNYDTEHAQRPRLMDKIQIDASQYDTKDFMSIKTNNYLIATIQYEWYTGGKLAILLSCVSDGQGMKINLENK